MTNPIEADPSTGWHLSYHQEPQSSQGEVRVKVGCLSCRARRIKCDEARPNCAQCGKGGFECIWADDHGSSVTPSRKRTRTRERSRRACLPCRDRKIRCAGPLGDSDDSPCPRCERLSLSCTWTRNEKGNGAGDSLQQSPKDNFRGRGLMLGDGGDVVPMISMPQDESNEDDAKVSASSPGLPLEELLRNKAQLQQLLRVYFGTVNYYGFLTFIHEPSFFRLLDMGKAPRELTAIMIACSLRFTGDASPSTLSRADSVFDETFPAIREQLYEGYGAIELMTVILAHRYEHTRGNFSSSWMLWGNAVRMMHFLSLHVFDETYPKPQKLRLNPLLKPEALRRLAWATYYLDTMADAGRHGVHAVSISGFHVQLPSDENAFVRGLDVTTGSLDPPPSPAISPSMSFGGSAHQEGPAHLGISAHLIRTAAMRRRVLHFNSRLKYSTDPPEKMLDDLVVFESQIKACVSDLPGELSYSEENLFTHMERRTAFILLHTVRHNCFLMLAMARLNVCARDGRLAELSKTVMRDRIRHAIPVSRIIADALRLGINCDPFIGVQAYTCLEVLLFDPPLLAQSEPSINPKETRFVTALKTLMEMIRKMAAIDEGMRHLLVEACRRLIHYKLAELLLPSDWEACRSDSFATGEDDREFDFKFFRWHRYENRSRVKRPRRKAPWAAEALLDLGTGLGSGGVSRANSPPPEESTDNVDAGSVAFWTDPINPAQVPNLAPSFSDGPTCAESTSSMETRPVAQVDMFATTTPEVLRASTSSLLEQRRWADLDYQWDRQGQYPMPNTDGEGLPANRLLNVGDDFARFLEQAGYAVAVTDETDPFSWASRPD